MNDAELKVDISREPPVSLVPFTDYFKGFENVEAVKAIFGAKTVEVLEELKVEFFSAKYGYMSVSDEDGHLLISAHHLRTSKFKVLYLDLVHELFHVKQFMDGEKLFQDEFEYVDSPIEVPAYKFTVAEARRIGMDRDEIAEYLRVEWVNDEQHDRLLKTLGI